MVKTQKGNTPAALLSLSGSIDLDSFEIEDEVVDELHEYDNVREKEQ